MQVKNRHQIVKKRDKVVADVDVNINKRTYRISCKDGEEDRIISLSAKIDNEVKLLVDKIGQLGEARMILLAALVLLDKSDENQDRMEGILKQTAEKIESVVNSIDAEK